MDKKSDMAWQEKYRRNLSKEKLKRFLRPRTWPAYHVSTVTLKAPIFSAWNMKIIANRQSTYMFTANSGIMCIVGLYSRPKSQLCRIMYFSQIICFKMISFYSILFYSILFYSLLFYSILFYSMICLFIANK